MDYLLHFFLEGEALQFVKGFLFGQIFLLIILAIAIQFLFLRVQVPRKSASWSRFIKAKNFHRLENDIIAKLVESRNEMKDESCAWFNILIGQILTSYRSSVQAHAIIQRLLENEFLSKSSPFIGPISLTNLNLGSNYPIFSRARSSYSEGGTLRTEIDIHWEDDISISIDSAIYINWPIPLMAALPVQLSLSIIRLSGTLTIELANTTESPEIEEAEGDGYTTNFAFKKCALFTGYNEDRRDMVLKVPQLSVELSFLPNLDIEFDIKSLMGHRTKLKDLPKVKQLISTFLRAFVEQNIVAPNSKIFHLPLFTKA